MIVKSYTPDHQMVPDRPWWNWRGENPNLSLYHCYRSFTYHRSICPTVPYHYHLYWEIIVYLEGNIQFVTDRGAFPLKRGDVIISPPHTLHQNQMLQESTLFRYHIFCMELDAFAPYQCADLTKRIATIKEPCVLSSPDHNITEKLLTALENMHYAAKKQK